jgi:hypothetical protein
MASAEDPHAPTEAAPEAVPPAADPPTEPTPIVDAGQATFSQPAGSALLGGTGGEVDPHPEKLVGAAFAGGLVAALFLKGLARRKHS